MKTVVLYDTALCNLNCRYCFISKSKAIHEVDKELEQCFLDKNYFPNLLESFISKKGVEDIESLEIWGGEPLLKLERIFSFVDYLLNSSSKFNKIFFSSNFTHDNVVPAIKNLYNFLATNYPLRTFNISIQISCDGPADITDQSRGLNTTQKIIQNLDNLLEENIFNHNFIKFYFSIKPTLDMVSLKKMLDYDYNIFYYKFFEENFLSKFDKKGILKYSSIVPVPNLASPTLHTQEDGIMLKNVVKIQREIEKQNKEESFFKYYDTITLFASRLKKQNYFHVNQNDFYSGNRFCGSGTDVIGLLPNNCVSGCHRAFAEYYNNYNQYYKKGLHLENTLYVPKDFVNVNHLIFSSPEEWKNYSELMSSYSANDQSFSTSFIFSNVNELRILAKCGLVDKKYEDLDEAISAIRKIMLCNGICIADNLLLTGISTCYGNTELKLFCNGALDYIFNEEVLNQ